MADEVQVTPEPEAPLSAAEGEDIIAAEMAGVSSERSGTKIPGDTSSSEKDEKKDEKKYASKTGDKEDEPGPGEGGEDGKPDAKVDETAAAAQKAIEAEQERQNKEAIAAAAKKLQEDQEKAAKEAAAAGGKPVPFDSAKAISEIVGEVGALEFDDIDEDGAPKKSTLAKWAETYPGVVNATTLIAAKMAERIVSERMAGIEAQLKPIVDAQENAKFEGQRSALYEQLAKPEFGTHTDAKAIIDSKEYVEAIDKAPDAVKQCADSWDPALQKLALDWYKTKKGIKSESVKKAEETHKKSTVTAAAGLRSTGKPVVKDGDELTNAEAKRLLDEAMAEGIKA